MKAGWSIETLDKVALIRNGGTPKSKVKEFWGDDIEWLTPKDMGKMDGDYIDQTPRKISELGLSKCSAKLVDANSVIMSTRAPIGHLAINTVPMAFNQGCRGLTPNQSLITKFLFYYLQANVRELNELGTGTTFKELSAGALKSFPIPLPPLEEQMRIVAVLDAAFEGLDRARAHVEANLQNARDLLQSAINIAFEETHRISGSVSVAKLCSMIVDCVNRTAPKTEYETEYLMIRTSNIRFGKLDLHNVKYVTEETYKTWTRRQVPSVGDVLLTREAPVGEACIVETDAKIFLGQRIVSYRADIAKLYPMYLLFAFQSLRLKDQFLTLGSGATVKHIRVPQSKELQVPSANLSKQIEISTRLASLAKTCATLEKNYQSKLTDLDDLRQSLLQKAFAGELT